MAWTLNSNSITAPDEKTVERNSQSVVHRAIDGSHSRDFVGDEKKIITGRWNFLSQVNFDVIKTAYEAQRDSGTSINLTISDANFSFNANVLIELSAETYPLPNYYGYRNITVKFIEV